MCCVLSECMLVCRNSVELNFVKTGLNIKKTHKFFFVMSLFKRMDSEVVQAEEVVQVYGICIRTLRLLVISVMIIVGHSKDWHL